MQTPDFANPEEKKAWLTSRLIELAVCSNLRGFFKSHKVSDAEALKMLAHYMAVSTAVNSNGKNGEVQERLAGLTRLLKEEVEEVAQAYRELERDKGGPLSPKNIFNDGGVQEL